MYKIEEDKIEQYSFDEFGNSKDVKDNEIGYTGYLYEKATQLNYAQARMYDTKSARFTTLDNNLNFNPLNQWFNGYNYVGNNPLNYVDNDGNVRTQTRLEHPFRLSPDRINTLNHQFNPDFREILISETINSAPNVAIDSIGELATGAIRDYQPLTVNIPMPGANGKPPINVTISSPHQGRHLHNHNFKKGNKNSASMIGYGATALSAYGHYQSGVMDQGQAVGYFAMTTTASKAGGAAGAKLASKFGFAAFSGPAGIIVGTVAAIFAGASYVNSVKKNGTINRTCLK